MTVPHDLTADLPPPRDDEPASLRRDIVDELTDHLECALHRELLRHGSSGPCETASGSADSSFRTAQQTVLTRFGDPAAVARRLWRDAMKEKLMAQKISIVLASVAIAAVVFLSVVLQQTLQHGREAQRLANEAQLALAQRHEQLSESLLKSLESLRTAPPAATTVDGWTPLTVKLVSEDGEAVQGEANVFGTQFGGGKLNLRRSTGQEGVIDFGMLPYGNYNLVVTATATGEDHGEQLTITPGMSGERTIVCPTSPPPEVQMRFAFNPPQTLQTDTLAYGVGINARPRRIGAGEWTSSELRSLYLWIDASGEILKQVADRKRGSLSPENLWSKVDGFVFSPPPPLREYVYELERVGMCVTDVAIKPAHPAPIVDEWTIEADAKYQPRYREVTFAPRADAENVWEIDISEDVWAAVIADFRRSPLARDVTIPDGWATVSVSEGQTENRGVGIRRHANLRVHAVNGQVLPENFMVIESAQLIGIDQGIYRPKGSSAYGTNEFVLLVTAEQSSAIEAIKAIDNIHFALEHSSKELDIPVLNEVVIQKLKSSTEGENQ